MSHLFGTPIEKTKKKMAPKLDIPAGGSGSDMATTTAQPKIESLATLRKNRGVAKGAYTRILTSLQGLHDEPDWLNINFKLMMPSRDLNLPKKKLTDIMKSSCHMKKLKKVMVIIWTKLKTATEQFYKPSVHTSTMIRKKL